MKAVIQRVKHSSVTVDGELISKINNGFMILLGVMDGDTEEDANKLVKKIPNLRIFEEYRNSHFAQIAHTAGDRVLLNRHRPKRLMHFMNMLQMN